MGKLTPLDRVLDCAGLASVALYFTLYDSNVFDMLFLVRYYNLPSCFITKFYGFSILLFAVTVWPLLYEALPTLLIFVISIFIFFNDYLLNEFFILCFPCLVFLRSSLSDSDVNDDNIVLFFSVCNSFFLNIA